jgi:hypothetical protein
MNGQLFNFLEEWQYVIDHKDEESQTTNLLFIAPNYFPNKAWS